MSSFSSMVEPVLVGPLGTALVLSLQVALIAGVARLVTAGMRDAAMQHRLWLTAILLSASLVPLHFILGGWPVPLPAFARNAETQAETQNAAINEYTTEPQVTREQPSPSDTSTDVVNIPEAAVNSGSSPAQISVDQLPTRTSPPVATEHKANSSTNVGSIVSLLLVFFYLYVAVLLLICFAIFVRRLERSVRQSPLASSSILDLARRVANSLDLKRLPNIRLVTGGEPMVVGVSHTVLLPDDFAQWPIEGQQAALAHELAHVVRRDLWSEALAKCACYLLWFHPAVWYMLRMLQRSSEQATDLKALSAGQSRLITPVPS